MTCTHCGQPVPESASEGSACGAGRAVGNPTMTGYGNGRVPSGVGAAKPAGAGSGSRTRTGPGGDRTLTTGAASSGSAGPHAGRPPAPLVVGTLLRKRYENLAALG